MAAAPLNLKFLARERFTRSSVPRLTTVPQLRQDGML
jgi:hypothetical protein